MTTPLHRNPEWLKQQADKGLWYGAIAKLAGVKPPTVVKYMVENRIYTKTPDTITFGLFKHFDTKIMKLCFIIPGEPTVKKNGNPTNKGMRLPNKFYQPYADLNIPMLQKLKSDLCIQTIDYPVTLEFQFYRTNHRRCDISNLYEAPQDVMVQAGILADDNCNIVVSHHQNSRVKYDKEFPRTEIYIHLAER